MKSPFGKPFWLAAAMAAVLAVAGCSSPASRISKNQAAFDTWPAAVQEKVRAGQVQTGFTPEQVKVALGEPDRIYTRTSTTGDTEVWAWRSRSPSFGLGLGIGGGSGGSGVGVGTGVGIGSGDRGDDRIRVVFSGGVVSTIEQMQQ
ncbi:hypothetical protein OPIT5_00530 [Opitutaceae bacterium TAV5]|nr:hypothetical protein OPIT5_00530 [Opitutaceae bacterium TAV5]